MADLVKAKNRIEKVLLNWYLDDPILLGVWCLVNKIESKDQETIGIDTQSSPPTIKYNPNFINSISDEKLELVMTYEGFKLLLRHPTNRLLNPKHISSLASSITITQLINSNMRILGDDFMDNIMNDLELVRGKYFEEYFRNIMDNIDEAEISISNEFNLSDISEENDKDENGYKNITSDSSLKEYFNPKGTSNKDWGDNNILDADIKHFVNERKGSSSQWGKRTSDIMCEIIAANTPKISVKEILRRFNTSIISTLTIPSRMKVNRRYDLQSPGYRRKLKSNLIFAIDTSGSMSDDDLKEGFSIVNSICKHANITYILFDTEIKNIETNLKKAKNSFNIIGRGGTDFQKVCDYANDNKADGLIIFTDGYANEPIKPRSKVMWLLTNKKCNPPGSWGLVAYLDKE